ncbi:Bestrophin-1 [Schistosoma japonicum]|nr:Bestrophin-1 [Schistosoma japonicum]
MLSSYLLDISNGQGTFVFLIILKKWKGSLYKLVWIDLLIYISAYYVLNLSYRFAMNDKQKIIFEEIVEFCVRTKGDIPISFLLGFFVSGIISRWYQMYLYIPWMNQIALQIASCINGKSEDGSRKIRLTIMRYMNLAWVLMMKRISDQIACRFIKNDDIGSVPSVLGPILPKRKSTNHKHLISRNTCQPWSIDASEVVRTTPSKSILQQQISQTQYTSPIKLDSPFNSIYAQPQTPNSSDVHTPLAPLATDEECGALPDAFEAADVVELRETFRAFNQDQKVKSSFGVLITETEISSFERIAADWFRRTKTNYTPEYWIPIQWAQRLTLKALESGYITDPKVAFYTVENIGRVRQKMQDLQVYSSIMIPLVYTQVVIIAVYSYFMCQIFACQFVDHRNEDGQHKVDLYVPIFSIFSFLFLMGWLKVALCVMNPFGDDDEDFQTSKILDYNLDVSYRSVFMDNDAFPENLTAPLGKKRTDETEIDELEKFLDQIDNEIAEVRNRGLPNDVSNLEMHPSFCERARNLCCCEKKKSPTPPVIVTNADYAKLNSLFKLQEPNFKSLYTTTQHTEFI